MKSNEQTITLRLGDCVDVMSTMESNSVGGVVTDPPYLISFMGKEFDKQGDVHTDPQKMQQWHKGWLEQAFRVLKPGGVIKAFAATRTYHRLLAAMEAVGFQDLRVESWVYAQGFPKSMDVSKALDKLAGEEPKVVGVRDPRSLYDGRERSSAAINTNWRESEGRSDTHDLSKQKVTEPVSDLAVRYRGYGTALKPSHEIICCGIKPLEVTDQQAKIIWRERDLLEEVLFNG
jgi:site-specific DNA-methyltransferase (adenine-specific)